MFPFNACEFNGKFDFFQLIEQSPESNDIENAEFEVDILKSNVHSNLHIQKVGENEINIVGIENSEQHEFIVEINVHNIDQCEHLDDKIDLTYMLFDKHHLELNKNTDDGQFHIDQNVTLKFKSSLNDLIVYFRNTFSLPIILTSHDNNLKGMHEICFTIKSLKNWIRIEIISFFLSNRSNAFTFWR